ncbi:MAG: ATP-binding protein [Gemmatimonadota bacterium]
MRILTVWYQRTAIRSGVAFVVGTALVAYAGIEQARESLLLGAGVGRLLLLTILFLIGLAFLALGAFRPLARLKPLLEACKRRARGQLDHRIEVASADEYGTLEASFNAMADEANQILESEQRFFSLSNTLLCIAGFDGYFRRVNSAWERVLGYSVEELTSRPWLDFVHPDDRERTIAEGSRLATTPDQALEFENRYVCRDGSVRWFSWNCVPVPGEELIYAVVSDMTQKKAVEDHLRQTQKMEAVGRFTAGIVHDFNNNLSVILSNAELIQEAVGPENQDIHGLSSDIVNAAHHGAALTRQLLGFSRESVPVKENVEPASFVRHEGEVIRRLLPAAIELKLVVPDGLPPLIADRTALQQILLNLVSNAGDAMPEGGCLTISLRSVELDDHDLDYHPDARRGAYLCLGVTDTGVGMDEATRQKIFDPFFTTKPTGKGTGLGMTSTYGLVRQHKGFVHVYSEVGIGTTVKVYFPASESQINARPLQVDTPGVKTTGTILVVEDNDSLRRSAARNLESLGYSVMTVGNGEEALEFFAGRPESIDLVFTDIVMPRMGGIELFHRLREQGCSVPVIFTTAGYEGTSLVEMAGPGTESTVVRKPWVRHELAAAINQAFRSPVDAAANGAGVP